ncbi:hypothetical protein F511_14677 [Dorcoceras hygrometricum]|uniref:Uncharacterized protein n=1 Tax=Dorcoceras hygrometricum TaxID=472368 RepID=A0A2Z7BRN6_9LAMI|nr:hypothetical protein F511_14677 [Dorcoceras hygrometricum]
MACHVAEEEAWRCPKHPSKSRRTGVCPTCLRERLGSLCPVCANVRPCGCVSNATSSSSSASSSFSFFTNGGDVSRASNLSETEPSFRRSRSVAIPFLRAASHRISTPSFLRRIATKMTKERYEIDRQNDEDTDSNRRVKDLARVVTRSRSVSTAAVAPGVRRSDLSSSPAKWKLWHFPSPMKVFRSSKTSKPNYLSRRANTTTSGARERRTQVGGRCFSLVSATTNHMSEDVGSVSDETPPMLKSGSAREQKGGKIYAVRAKNKRIRYKRKMNTCFSIPKSKFAEDVIMVESPGSLENPKRIVIVMDALREFSIDIVEWVFRNFTLKECCTVTILGIMPWLNIPLSSKTWGDVWSMDLENLDYIQERRDGRNYPKCQKVQRLMDLCAKYGVIPAIRTEMGHPLRLVVVEKISSLHATLVVFDRYHEKKNIEFYAGKVPCNLLVVNDNGSVDLIKKHKPMDIDVQSPAT